MNAEVTQVFPGYGVTEDGRVISETNWRGYGDRELRQHKNKDGYFFVRLNIEGKRRKLRVHTLVALAFHGERPSPQHQVRHLDGTRTNNHANNLRWGTISENAMDRQRHGTCRAAENGRASSKKGRRFELR